MKTVINHTQKKKDPDLEVITMKIQSQEFEELNDPGICNQTFRTKITVFSQKDQKMNFNRRNEKQQFFSGKLGHNFN